MKRLVKKAEVSEQEKQEILDAVFGEETTIVDEFKNLREKSKEEKEETY